VAASNEGARALYEEIGFGEVGEESAAWPGQTSLGERGKGGGRRRAPSTQRAFLTRTHTHTLPSHTGREILLRADVDAAAADSE
jgi:hypothetical protein